MLTRLETHVKRFLKRVKFDAAYYFLRGLIFVNHEAITVEKDLLSLPPLNHSLYEAGLNLIAITRDTLPREGKKGKELIFPPQQRFENRYRKAIKYLNKGYRGFALVRGKEVCGDIWYVGGGDDQKGRVHPDLKWLGIQCRNGEAYAFDMHLYPQQRGKNMASLLQSGVLHELKKKGFTRAFGYYWANYIPALWLHRSLQWTETKRIKVSRFLFFRRSR